MYGSRFGWGGGYYPRGYLAAGIGYPYGGFYGYPGCGFGYPRFGFGGYPYAYALY